MLAYGELGDRLGPRACFGVGASLAWLGLLLLALGARTGSDALWLSALLCIGVSGPGVFMGCLFMGEKHPNLRAVISAVGAAMWDGSALVFKTDTFWGWQFLSTKNLVEFVFETR